MLKISNFKCYKRKKMYNVYINAEFEIKSCKSLKWIRFLTRIKLIKWNESSKS